MLGRTWRIRNIRKMRKHSGELKFGLDKSLCILLGAFNLSQKINIPATLPWDAVGLVWFQLLTWLHFNLHIKCRLAVVLLPVSTLNCHLILILPQPTPSPYECRQYIVPLPTPLQLHLSQRVCFQGIFTCKALKPKGLPTAWIQDSGSW